MKIVIDTITIGEIKTMAANLFGDMVKAVVDVERGIIAINAELHSDLEALLLDDGSKQKNLWGINIYPEQSGDDFVEFDSMINLRPSQGNKTRGVEDKALRAKIIGIVTKKVKK
ncbi:MAG: DUF5674 family protein [Candidatus Omnitrophota bacterium]|nr:DUF5674 family protein [Candidatus Omnitrophota bacterium]